MIRTLCSTVGSSDADVALCAVHADAVGLVDAVVSDQVVGLGVAAWSGEALDGLS